MFNFEPTQFISYLVHWSVYDMYFFLSLSTNNFQCTPVIWSACMSRRWKKKKHCHRRAAFFNKTSRVMNCSAVWVCYSFFSNSFCSESMYDRVLSLIRSNSCVCWWILISICPNWNSWYFIVASFLSSCFNLVSRALGVSILFFFIWLIKKNEIWDVYRLMSLCLELFLVNVVLVFVYSFLTLNELFMNMRLFVYRKTPFFF